MRNTRRNGFRPTWGLWGVWPIALTLMMAACARFSQEGQLASGQGGLRLTDTAGVMLSLNSSPTIAWSMDNPANVDHYEVAIGTSSAGANTMAWTNVGKATSYQATNLALQSQAGYFPSVRAIDRNGNVISVASGNRWTAMDPAADPDPSTIDPVNGCPINYLYVPPPPGGSGNGFCVSKFEMKKANLSGNPSPRASGLPFPNASRQTAKGYCSALGPKYALMTNVQWQTLAHAIEGTAQNWSGGAVGAGALYRGYSGVGSGIALGLCHDFLSVADINNPYDQTGHSASDPMAGGKEMRRTFRIPNGSVQAQYNEVWDLSGNVWEIVDSDDTFGCSTTDSATDCYNHIDSGTNEVFLGRVSGPFKAAFGPLGDYHAKVIDDLFGGLGAVERGPVGGAIWRGETSCHDSKVGLFGVHLGVDNTSTSTDSGFRCVYNR